MGRPRGYKSNKMIPTPEYKKAHDRIFKGSKKIKLKKKKEVKEKPGPQLIDSSKMI